MALDLADYERKAHEAVRTFWGNRTAARQQQVKSGKTDQGERAGVTSGKNMDGFAGLISDVVRLNGLGRVDIHHKRAVLTLPGFFRPTKLWDLVVIHNGQLIAAIEMKSHVGPSFGNNFNNRAEEAIGTSHDFWTAYREGAFGPRPRPFLGWFMLVEDAPGSRSPVQDKTPHYPVFECFGGASYLGRYDLLCQKLVLERLYTAAAAITTPRTAAKTGKFSCLSDMTGLRTFVASLAGHVATEVARFG